MLYEIGKTLTIHTKNHSHLIPGGFFKLQKSQKK